MTDLVFPALLALSIVVSHVERRAFSVERRTLLNMVKADTPAEFIALEKATAPRVLRNRRDEDAPRPENPIGL